MFALFNKIRRLFGDRKGIATVEFAIALPVLVLMILGGVEIARYILLQQKLNGIAVTMADLVAQSETLSSDELDTLFTAVDYVARPFQLGTDGVVVVSSIGATNGNPVQIYWQQSGGGSLSTASEIAPSAGSITMPSGFVIRDGESVIVAEVFFDFTSFFAPHIVPSTRLYHRAFLRPRFGALRNLG
jgi:hypothetical protein